MNKSYDYISKASRPFTQSTAACDFDIKRNCPRHLIQCVLGFTTMHEGARYVDISLKIYRYNINSSNYIRLTCTDAAKQIVRRVLFLLEVKIALRAMYTAWK